MIDSEDYNILFTDLEKWIECHVYDSGNIVRFTIIEEHSPSVCDIVKKDKRLFEITGICNFTKEFEGQEYYVSRVEMEILK